MATLVVALDQVTKQWAVSRLAAGPCTPDSCIDVLWTLRFHLHFNRGASFSTGQGLGPWFGVLALFMSVYLVRQAVKEQRLGITALFGGLAGGAVGNLADRLFRADDGFLSGAVIDFIDLQWWPIFNIADMAIVGGVLSLIGLSLVRPQDPAPQEHPPKEHPPKDPARQASEQEPEA